MTDDLAAAVIGCGGAGANHASGYETARGARLAAVCDLDEERAAALADEHGVAAFADAGAMLADVEPDVVSVATPETAHVEPTVAALDAGAHVLCEKIMADSLEGAREMVAAAERAGRTLAVDYNYRHMPAFARIRAAVDDGTLGDVRLASVDAHAYGWHHGLDLLASLLGDPRAVSASLEHDPEAVRERFRFEELLYVPSHAAAATVEFAGDAVGTIASSVHGDLDDHLLDVAVYGTDGRVRIDGMTPADSTGRVAPGPLADDLRAVESITLAESFERSVAAFVGAVHAGERPPTTGDDGLRTMRLENAVLRADDSGREVAP